MRFLTFLLLSTAVLAAADLPPTTDEYMPFGIRIGTANVYQSESIQKLDDLLAQIGYKPIADQILKLPKINGKAVDSPETYLAWKAGLIEERVQTQLGNKVNLQHEGYGLVEAQRFYQKDGVRRITVTFKLETGEIREVYAEFKANLFTPKTPNPKIDEANARHPQDIADFGAAVASVAKAIAATNRKGQIYAPIDNTQNKTPLNITRPDKRIAEIWTQDEAVEKWRNVVSRKTKMFVISNFYERPTPAASEEAKRGLKSIIHLTCVCGDETYSDAKSAVTQLILRVTDSREFDRDEIDKTVSRRVAELKKQKQDNAAPIQPGNSGGM